MSDLRLKPGTNFCRCAACGEYFGGVNGFDLHRRGDYPDRACLPPSEVADKEKRPLLRLNERGYWIRSYRHDLYN